MSDQGRSTCSIVSGRGSRRGPLARERRGPWIGCGCTVHGADSERIGRSADRRRWMRADSGRVDVRHAENDRNGCFRQDARSVEIPGDRQPVLSAESGRGGRREGAGLMPLVACVPRKDRNGLVHLSRCRMRIRRALRWMGSARSSR